MVRLWARFFQPRLRLHNFMWMCPIHAASLPVPASYSASLWMRTPPSKVRGLWPKAAVRCRTASTSPWMSRSVLKSSTESPSFERPLVDLPETMRAVKQLDFGTSTSPPLPAQQSMGPGNSHNFVYHWRLAPEFGAESGLNSAAQIYRRNMRS